MLQFTELTKKLSNEEGLAGLGRGWTHMNLSGKGE